MKVLTINFITCAVKTCKTSQASFPLHAKDCELVSDDALPPNLALLTNVLPRVDWGALMITARELGFNILAHLDQAPTREQLEADEKMQKDLHVLLLETQISDGALVCGNCGHEYKIREGIANFLLPNHLV